MRAPPILRSLAAGALSAAFALASAPRGHSADANGRYLIAGEGAAACADFNAAFNKGQSETTLRYASWANGYATALNETLDGAYNVLGAHTLDEFLVDVALACQANAGQPFHDAVRATLTAYYPQRATAAP